MWLCTAALLLCLVINNVQPDTATAADCGVTVVLQGATGDLAKRYIWPALFENHAEHTEQDCLELKLLVFGASRSEVTNREVALDKLLVNVESYSPSFKNAIRLVKLKTVSDYKELDKLITFEYTKKNLREVGRIIYLAIPPSAYEHTIVLVSTFLKPSNQSSWLRVVLEKPFGHDLTSAQNLQETISNYLMEDKVYRIDHYLGKWGVQQIAKFLSLNRKWVRQFWNNNGIQLVEVAMEETLDIRGRASFYNANGVLRDVHQNHLTEILALLLMNPSASQGEKLRVLSRLFPPRLHHTVLGQYAHYQRHLEEEGIYEPSNTPTYASAVLFSKDPKWRGIPFVLTSGKQMSKRRAFVKVLFKTGIFSDWTNSTLCPPEMRFVIQGERLSPGILLTDHFTRRGLKFGAELAETVYIEPDSRCVFKYFKLEGNINTNSYINLISAMLRGRREYFVDSESLLESWRIWTPLLDELQLTRPHPLPYSPDSLEVLGFSIHGSKITPNTEMKQMSSAQVPSALPVFSTNSSVSSRRFQCRTIAANKYKLSTLLAEDLYRQAVKSIEAHGSFHVALPGGSTPLLLLDTLSLDYQHLFPWEHTHIWQTDERCVDPRAKHSNLQQLSQRLLSNVLIPYQNIYPMPTDLPGGLCLHSDNGAGLYKRQLTSHAHDGRLDYVLLGVGSDGHIASLFPAGETMATSEELVQLVEPQGTHAHRRMTLTMKCLLESRKIGLVFIGESKKEMVKNVQKYLMDESESVLPVVKLIQRAQKEQVSVYVDSELL